MLRALTSASVVEAIGALLVVLGLGLWSLTLALIVAGVMLIVAAQLVDGKAKAVEAASDGQGA